MGIPAKIVSVLGGSIGDTFAKVAAVFKVPPAQVEEHAFELEQLKTELAKKAFDAATAEIQTGGEIIKAEAQSQSVLARNVRPFLLLIWGCLITLNSIAPLIARFWIPGFEAIPLDPWVYKLTAIGFTGYVTARTWEKVTEKD